MKTIELPPTRPSLTEDASTAPLPAASIGNNIRASWNFSLDNIRGDIARYSPEAKQALTALFRWCIDPLHPMSKPDVARRLNTSDNTLYKLYTGKYRHPQTGEQLGPSAELIIAIHKFLAREAEQFSTGQKDFILTPTARKIVTACELARESRTPVFIVGPSHIGKTWTLERYYTPRNNHGATIYCRMRAASGLGGMVRRIADDVGISDNSNTAALIDRIKNALAPNMLLILDELHLLAHTYRAGSFHNCMEVIREIYDEVGCGMVLSFTLLDEVRAASQKQLQQLWRRGVHKVFLPVMPTKKDIELILNHHGLEFPEPKQTITIRDGRAQIVENPYQILKQVAQLEALKAVTERIRYGHKLAAGGKLKWEHFVTAHLLIAKNATQDGEWDLES